MGEEFPKNEIFTPEQWKKIAQGAADNELAEAKRAGHVPYNGPELEEFDYLDKPSGRKPPSQINGSNINSAEKTNKKLSDFQQAERATKNRNYNEYKKRKDIFN